jgi:hypothetical protein
VALAAVFVLILFCSLDFLVSRSIYRSMKSHTQKVFVSPKIDIVLPMRSIIPDYPHREFPASLRERG